ncbi:MAG: rhomboid family intramembrane serine protease [Simkaniaceae bacterium]|nr:rhomboid family intramembrane serine protease [Simkaniaceae bacterium]
MIKRLIVPLGLISLFACVWSPLTLLFPLSLWGVQHSFFFQVFTYILVSPVHTLSHLLSFAINLYLLYSLGNSLIEQFGKKKFFTLFIGGTLAGGVTGLITLYITHSPLPLFGMTAPIFALLGAFIYLYPHLNFLLYFTFPVKGKFLFLTIIGITSILDLANHQYVPLWAHLAAAGFGYFYGYLLKGRKASVALPGKIYDFKTGDAILRDEEFIDACLAKVSQLGAASLTFKERYRLNRIAKQKRSQPS